MRKLTRKQAAVIFSNYKKGTLKIKEMYIKLMYQDCVENTYTNPYNYNMVNELIGNFNLIIDAIFNNDFETANKLAQEF